MRKILSLFGQYPRRRRAVCGISHTVGVETGRGPVLGAVYRSRRQGDSGASSPSVSSSLVRWSALSTGAVAMTA